MNESNLKSFSEMTPEQHKELSRKGGVNSGASKRRKKNLQQMAKMCAGLYMSEKQKEDFESQGVDLSQIDPEDMTLLGMVVIGQIIAAANGNSLAAANVEKWLDKAEEAKRERLEREKLEAEVAILKQKIKLLEGSDEDEEIVIINDAPRSKDIRDNHTEVPGDI